MKTIRTGGSPSRCSFLAAILWLLPSCGGEPSSAHATTGGGGASSSAASGQSGSGSGSGLPACSGESGHLAFQRALDLPGRGMALAWSPDGQRIATGGHFKDAVTGLRYDTKIYSTLTGQHEKSFDCHYYWVIGLAWANNPFLGEVIATGGYDHAVKLWNASGKGSVTCNPGQFITAEGALQRISEIDGATTALAFSPDGRYLAGANRDGTIRIWQMEPGPHQFLVVGLWHDDSAGNFLSLSWSPDGKRIATGDRLNGRVAVWAFDPSSDAWDDAAIDAYAKLGFAQTASWFTQNPTLVTQTPLWSEQGHDRVWNVRFSPDGGRVAAASSDGALSIFDAATGAATLKLAAPSKTPLHGLDWSPSGRYLAAGGADHNVYVFDAGTGALYDTLTGHADVVTATAFSPDGCSLATTAGGPRVSTINEIHDQVTGPDQTVRLWSYP